MVKEQKITALATDPIYIGTGGYTIGRVDNTIVRDPITRLPKIPGSSLAGTWRYYVALELNKYIKSEFRNFKDRLHIIKEDGEKSDKMNKILVQRENIPLWVKNLDNNLFSRIQCAGQDNVGDKELADVEATNKEGKTGHCGYCIVCKSFGFSKKDISWQGMLFFSDLEILLFPVYTRLGTRWITTKERIRKGESPLESYKIITKDGRKGNLNLGWLNLEIEEGKTHNINDYSAYNITADKIIIVHEDIFSQIVNSNLEVRTSVSIDPLTGAAKEGALFTSEAIPRGTVFSGSIRIFDKEAFAGWEQKIGELPSTDMIEKALKDSKKYYESLGIGGMTTRGFGRLKIELKEENNNSEQNQTSTSTTETETQQN